MYTYIHIYTIGNGLSADRVGPSVVQGDRRNYRRPFSHSRSIIGPTSGRCKAHTYIRIKTYCLI